jgi:hypothetical protein
MFDLVGKSIHSFHFNPENKGKPHVDESYDLIYRVRKRTDCKYEIYTDSRVHHESDLNVSTLKFHKHYRFKTFSHVTYSKIDVENEVINKMYVSVGSRAALLEDCKMDVLIEDIKKSENAKSIIEQLSLIMIEGPEFKLENYLSV